MKLAARDRRRAARIATVIDTFYWVGGVDKLDKSRDLIAAALKREREETSMAAAQWFLFADKNQRARVKRFLSKPGAKANFGAEQKKGKR